jgi:Rrf2 family iron-sulfur cluster assembly transcriptional regulator
VKLTTRSRYALRALVELANQPEDKAVPLSIIAKRQRVKPKYLEQILYRLRQAGLIKGKKGPGGGFYLARHPKEIKLKDVLDAVGESTAPLLCVSGKADKYCSLIAPCKMNGCWQELRGEIDNFLKKRSLWDVCNNRQ